MFPFSFEWAWDMGHYLFLGGMWYAIIILSLGLGHCITKAIWDTFFSDEKKDAHHHH